MLLKIASCCAFTLLAVLRPAAQQKNQPAGPPADFQISGTLVDVITGRFIPHARVVESLVTQPGNFATVMTSQDGRFSFPNLTAGKYTLNAQARGYLSQSFNQHDGYYSAVVAGPGVDSSNLIFALTPEGAISGVVSDEAGEPVRDAQVTLYTTGISGGVVATRPRGNATTNDEGAYHFGHVPPGRYLVAVNAHPWYAQNRKQENNLRLQADQIVVDPQANRQLDVAYPITFFAGATEASEATPIVLARGDKATADITVQPVPALHIHIPAGFDFGRGVGLQKRVFDGSPTYVSEQFERNKDGSSDIVGLAPGHYILQLGGNDSEKAQSREIDLNSFGQADNAQGSAYVPVSAKLELEGGVPAGPASLQLLNKKSREGSSHPFDSSGALAFQPGIAPGTYEISLSSGSGIYVKSVTATGARVSGRTVEIRPGAEVKLAIIAASGQGSINGTALRGDKGFSGAMILLVPADPAHNQVLFRRDLSDSDGTFTLPNVVPGAYTLLAIENGWELEWTKPAVLKNYMAAGVAVQVQPGGKHELKVTVQ